MYTLILKINLNFKLFGLPKNINSIASLITTPSQRVHAKIVPLCYSSANMNDIKIPDSHHAHGGKKDFEVTHVGAGETVEPGEKVKVKFSKFVHLVATHDFEGVMKNHENEDVILSTNLLTDLANAHEEIPNNGRKMPLFFIVGIIVGVLVAYLVLRFI